MRIINYPHPTLRHVSKPLRRVDAELRSLVAQMLELMYHHEGVGLAANQVDLPYRVFVMNITGDPAQREHELVMINPVLSGLKGSDTGEEGCLSIPQVNADVKRAARITVNAFNLAGEELRAEVDGLFARIVQHETDHLDGKLFIDRISPTSLARLQEPLEDLEIEFESLRKRGEIPDEADIAARLKELEALRT